MESMIGFDEAGANGFVEGKSSNMKLVPWISWDEWKFVRERLFSPNHESVVSAIDRVRTWQSRGCIPVLVEVTASIVEIQQKDPFFRNDLDRTGSSSEELAMLYCMAIMRLVNGVVEKTRRKNEVSIGEAADAMSIPRILIDIRHEGSHRGLPSLQLLRLASQKALDWLVWYYWEPQENMIVTSSNSAANLDKEIKQCLLEIALCLKEKQSKSGPSNSKGKSALATQLAKSLKSALRLYSSSSEDVVNILLDYLLNALNSYLMEKSEDQIDQKNEIKGTDFDIWSSVVMKLSRKNPEFLLSLTQAVLDKLETNEVFDRETGDKRMMGISHMQLQIKLHWCLLGWLTGSMKKLSESRHAVIEKHLSNVTLRGLLRRCLLVSSALSNQAARSAAVTLAQLTGNAHLLHKVKKLVSLHKPLVSEPEPSNSLVSDTHLSQEESLLHQAKEKFHSITQLTIPAPSEEPPVKSRWVVAKSWNPCPIGMLPHNVGFSGRLPTLDHRNNEASSSFGRKRRAESENCDKELMVSAKKMKEGEPEEDRSSSDKVDDSGDCTKGQLLIQGCWRSIGEQEFLDIASTVRILVV